MSNRTTLLILAALSLALGGCGVIGGIFKGGFIIGLIVAIIVIGILVKLFGGRGG